jgi:UDP-3-O-[3-hydroxymyristoyl] glucosamine N-acyltransferase
MSNMTTDEEAGPMTAYTLDEVARAIGAELEGDAAIRVQGIAPLDQAGPDELCYAESAKLLDGVRAGLAGAVIVGPDFPALAGRNLLRAGDPRAGFMRALELFRPDRRLSGLHPSAVVSTEATLAADVGVGPLAVIEPGAEIGAGSQIRAGAYIGRDVQIGVGCDIGETVVLLDGTVVGDRCTLHPGVVLGADGYGYHWMGDHHHKIPQLGIVVIEDDVEIGAHTCIDRATLGETRIGFGSKLDNLVHIAHNNRIGRHVLLTGQVAIAGSSRLGDGVVAGGQAGVADHVTVGDGVQIGAQAGVIGDIAAGEKVWGTPARPMGGMLREQAALARLPELLRAFRRQEKELQTLRDRIAALEAAQAQ